VIRLPQASVDGLRVQSLVIWLNQKLSKRATDSHIMISLPLIENVTKSLWHVLVMYDEISP